MKAVELAAISKMLLTNFTNNPAECSLCPSHNGCASKEALAPKINCPEELKFLQINLRSIQTGSMVISRSASHY